jgi:hypothetical protein
MRRFLRWRKVSRGRSRLQCASVAVPGVNAVAKLCGSQTGGNALRESPYREDQPMGFRQFIRPDPRANRLGASGYHPPARVAFFTLVAFCHAAFADPAADLKRVQEMVKRMEACGTNLACLEKAGQELQASMPATPSASVGSAVVGACRGIMQGLAGRYCIPVTVRVEARSLEQQMDRIYSGTLPDPGRPFISRYLAYRWHGEARGGLIHNADFSEYMLSAFGRPETIGIDELKGYEQSWDSYRKKMDRKQYRTGNPTVRRPFDLSMTYPVASPDGLRTNVTLVATEVETVDDYVGNYSAGGFGPYDPINPAFVVQPHQMRKFVEAGGFERILNWRIVQPDGEDFSEASVRLSVIIGKGCEDDIHLTVHADHKEGDYVFSDDKRGRLAMKLRATVTPGKYADDIVWTLPEISGSIREIVPQTARGPQVEVVYEGLPKRNEAFGPKTIRASVKTGRCSANAEKTVRVFYFRDQKNNPGGQDPNWSYYWPQTPAGRPGGLPADIRYGGTDFFKCGEPGIPAMYSSVALPDALVVCDLTKLGPHMTLVYPKVSQQVPSTLKTRQTATVTGIDAFAVAVLHEYQHMRNRKAWSAFLNQPDADKDGIPDVLEPSMGFDPTQHQTYYGNDPLFKNIGGDEEFRAYEAMYPYAEGSNDPYDWAVPGKNFPIK